MDIDPADLEAYRRSDSRDQARAAFDRILGRAQRSLCLFDDCGEFWGVSRRAFADAVHALLRRKADATVTIVVHDPRHIETRCPRLVELVRRHSPRFRVLQSDPAVRGFSSGIVIADATVVLRRPHFDRPRVFTDFDEAAVAAADRLFRELAEGASPGLSGSVTGL
jgi:hypothetical protein